MSSRGLEETNAVNGLVTSMTIPMAASWLRAMPQAVTYVPPARQG
jgi:hypothetical protein